MNQDLTHDLNIQFCSKHPCFATFQEIFTVLMAMENHFEKCNLFSENLEQ